MVIIAIFLLQALLIRFTPRKYYRIICFLTTVILSYLSFNIVVYEASDLFRHHIQIDYYRSLGWSFAVDTGRAYRNPLTAVSFWLCSFLDNNNWYQAIAIFIIYSCIFSLIWKIAEDREYDHSWLAKATLFVTLCFSYYYAVYALRIWVVFAVLALCFYVDCVRNAHRIPCIIIYVMCIFFHYASLLLIVPRILVYFFVNTKKTQNDFIKKTFIAIIFISAAFLFLQSDFASIIFEKTDGYSKYDTRGKLQTLNCWARILPVAVMAFIYHKKYSKNFNEKRYSLIAILMFLVTVLQFNNYQITLRFADALVAFSPLFIIPNYKKGAFSVSDLCMLGAAFVNFVYIVLFDYRLLSFMI